MFKKKRGLNIKSQRRETPWLVSPLNSLPCRCVSRQSSAAAAQLTPSAKASLQLGCPKPLRLSPLTAVEKKGGLAPPPNARPRPAPEARPDEPGTAPQDPLGHQAD